MARPSDLEPEEFDFYELFGSLRVQMVDIISDLVASVSVGIKHRQDEDERLHAPDPTEILSQNGASLLDVVMRLLGLQKGDDLDDD